MPPFKLKVRSMRFAAELRERVRSFQKAEKLYVKAVAPESLRWWYWLEFGTALRGEAGHASGHKYPIDPVNALVLSWPDGSGGKTFRAHVDHPGIRPRAFVRKVLPLMRRDLSAGVMRSLVYQGFRSESLQFGLEKSMEETMIRVVESLALETNNEPRTDQWGKGKTAAELFREGVQIETPTGVSHLT